MSESKDIDMAMRLTRDESVTEKRQITEAMLNPVTGNAENCIRYRQQGWTGLGINEALEVLQERAQAVSGGDTTALEATLVAQTAALNSVFVEMVRRSHLNMGEHPQAMEAYMKLAFRAQSQCRATIETIAVMKNPPVYARQANINNGGQQQVNNGVPPPSTSTPNARTYEANSNNQPIKLLEAVHGQWVDTRKKSKASRSNQTLEAMGEIHRT